MRLYNKYDYGITQMVDCSAIKKLLDRDWLIATIQAG